MSFRVRLGVPEIEQRWNDLEQKRRTGTLTGDEARFFKKWIKAVAQLERDPRHPGLTSHEIEALSRRYGRKVWQSYLDNRKPAAGRLYWVYGPARGEITIIGLETHPEEQKRGGYERVRLSELPPAEE